MAPFPSKGAGRSTEQRRLRRRLWCHHRRRENTISRVRLLPTHLVCSSTIAKVRDLFMNLTTMWHSLIKLDLDSCVSLPCLEGLLVGAGSPVPSIRKVSSIFPDSLSDLLLVCHVVRKQYLMSLCHVIFDYPGIFELHQGHSVEARHGVKAANLTIGSGREVLCNGECPIRVVTEKCWVFHRRDWKLDVVPLGNGQSVAAIRTCLFNS
ncbi:hypothetical protein F4775DRAFT_470858 [Biscogniauxia sp. FL1348]|nr:hypothetical protein F4775DRAFT_470858 [Biscogniauxia sp. FL1348]